MGRSLHKPMEAWSLCQYRLGTFGPNKLPLSVVVVQDAVSEYVIEWNFHCRAGTPSLESVFSALYLALRVLHARPDYVLVSQVPEPYALAVLRTLGIAVAQEDGERTRFAVALQRFLTNRASWQAQATGFNFMQGAFGRWVHDWWNQEIGKDGLSPFQRFFRYRKVTAAVDESALSILTHIPEKRRANLGTRIPVSFFRV